MSSSAFIPSCSREVMVHYARSSSEFSGGFSLAALSNMGTSSHNRYYHCVTPTPSEVTIIRPHHPLRGQRFEVLHTGTRQLVVRALDGVAMRLPREWTDADGAPAAEVGTGAVFSVQAIRALLETVEALRRRRAVDVSGVSGACRGPEGGTHAEAGTSRPMGRPARGAVATAAGARPASRD